MIHQEHTEPRVYELGYHLVSTLPEEKIPEASGAVRAMIEQISKDIIAEELPIFIDLAYPIVKTVEHKNQTFTDAYFGWIKFAASPEGIATLEESLKKDHNVLRYLVVKTLRENTLIAKKFPSSKTKRRDESTSAVADVSEEAQVETLAAVADDQLDKVIEKLVL
ncbi:MAG: 30S ribosomal protein S6 [Patescibacteria group bacterium]